MRKSKQRVWIASVHTVRVQCTLYNIEKQGLKEFFFKAFSYNYINWIIELYYNKNEKFIKQMTTFIYIFYASILIDQNPRVTIKSIRVI